MKLFEDITAAGKVFRHGKFYMNHPKSFKKCSVRYKILQNFNVFQPGYTSRKRYVSFASYFK